LADSAAAMQKNPPSQLAQLSCILNTGVCDVKKHVYINAFASSRLVVLKCKFMVEFY